MDSIDKFKKFNQSPYFSELPDSFWQFCLEHGRTRHFTAKQYLFFSEDEGKTVYFLLEGRIELLLTSEFNEKVFRVLQSPAFFPESLLDGKNYPYAALAKESSELFAIDRNLLKQYLQKNPELLWAFYQSMALDLRRAYRQIKNVSLGDARSRLGAKLFALAHVHGETTSDGTIITIPLSAKDLAGMCSLARESVSRILSELKSEEIVEMEKRKITIRSLERLRDWVHERRE